VSSKQINFFLFIIAHLVLRSLWWADGLCDGSIRLLFKFYCFSMCHWSNL